LLISASSESYAAISHGPVLGSLSDHGAAIWVRTDKPESLYLQLKNGSGEVEMEEKISTREFDGNTYIFRLTGLRENSRYQYTINSADNNLKGAFRTLKAVGSEVTTKIVFGSCYSQGLMKKEKGRIFEQILKEKPDAVIILGDVPYSDDHNLAERRADHRVFRENPYFSKLAAAVPIYAIWDDHDYGTDNSDGDFNNKETSLKVFNEFWPNPENPARTDGGIYTSFVMNNIEVFLLDTRYFSRQSKISPTLLGEKQFSWLCDSLQASMAKYKILASGVPLASTNVDGWGGEFFMAERERLFSCINDNQISGVLMISGDFHRAEVHEFKLDGWLSANSIHDFTSSPFKSRIIKRKKWFENSLVYSYDKEDSLFSKLIFNADTENTGIEYTLISPQRGALKTLSISDKDLNINKAFGDDENILRLIVIGILSIIIFGALYRWRYMNKN